MGACRVSSCSITANATTKPAPGLRRGYGRGSCARGCTCWTGWSRRPSASACCFGVRTRESSSCASFGLEAHFRDDPGKHLEVGAQVLLVFFRCRGSDVETHVLQSLPDLGQGEVARQLLAYLL